MKSCVSVLPLSDAGWRSEVVRSVGCLVTTVLGDVERIVFKTSSCLNCSSACPVTKTVPSDLFYTSTVMFVVAIIVQDTHDCEVGGAACRAHSHEIAPAPWPYRRLGLYAREPSGKRVDRGCSCIS